jgi:DNA-binding beta-propeller fold protein YncE
VAFTQLAQLLVDEKRNRLLASNTDGRDIIAIDISSAERSIVLNNGIGDGAGLIWPGYIETTADDKFAYVLDDRLRATDTLFKIDLQTGNRTTVSDLGPYDNQGTYGVALDESNNRIFIAMGLAILMVDLDTGAQKVIASSDVGLGIAMESFITIGDMVYDHQNNRLLVSSGWQNGFVAAIDPVTFNRTILLDSTMGNGPALTSISAMALDGENKKLYVSNTDAEDKTSILAINIETGDRVFLFDQCKNDGGSLYQLVDSYDTKIILDEKSQQLYATSNNEILIKNLASDKCKVINSPADDLALLSDSTLLGLSLGLSQINPYNGERAIISK